MTHLPVEHRATIANMSPEYGATCGIFPIDEATLTYLRFTGRSEDHVALVEAYAKEQGLWASELEPVFAETLELDLTTVEPSLAGPVAAPGPGVALRVPRQVFTSASSDAQSWNLGRRRRQAASTATPRRRHGGRARPTAAS